MNKINFLTIGLLYLISLQLLAQPKLALKDSIGSGLDTSADGDIFGPQGVAVDPDGNIFVADENNNRVQKFDKNGNFLSKFGSGDPAPARTESAVPTMNRPTGIARDSDGNLFITNRSGHTIHKYDKDGTYIKTIGSTNASSDNGDFNSPTGIVVDSKDNIYVVDRFNARVQKLTNDGLFIKVIGSEGLEDGQFQYPFGLAIDKEDNIYVTDNVRGNVQKFDSDGKFLLAIGSKGEGNGKFETLVGTAVSTQGYIYTSDNGTDSIQVFSPAGDFIKKYATPIPFFVNSGGGGSEARINAVKGTKAAFFITFDDKDNFYISGNHNKKVYLFSTEQEINIKAGLEDVASAGTVDFGDLLAGLTKDSTFTIENLGGIDLKLEGTTGSQLVLSGTDASDFELTQAEVTDVIGGFSSNLFTVSFQPTSEGDKTATLTLMSNDTDEATYTVTLNGKGTVPVLAIDEGSFDESSSLYPNPTVSGFVTIQLPEKTEGYIQVTDINGKIITQQQVLRSDHAVVDLSNETTGLYLISIQGENRKPAQLRVLKN